ncbi:MAG: DUF4058 family protein [Caldilineaceae bacterium]|nr:DUF4058 family protein [Caldilineaceae bacterium]
MGIYSAKNQYYGINAHLHSDWQRFGGWHGFHGNHISDLLRAMRAQLLPMGYTADLANSLQIRRLDDAVPETLQEPPLSEREFTAIAVYQVAHRGRDQGTPVAWIELLSPSNKGGSQDAAIYREKRSQLIHSGLVFVELDYLHESGSTLGCLGSYRIRQRQAADANAHPYRIAVIDPRPTFDEGKAYIAEFDVDEPIPTLTIPLNGEDRLLFDFDAPYQKSYTETLYGLELVDYRQLPLHFDRYSPADQARIANRMVAVLRAVERGEGLEMGPFVAAGLPLVEALVELNLSEGS